MRCRLAILWSTDKSLDAIFYIFFRLLASLFLSLLQRGPFFDDHQLAELPVVTSCADPLRRLEIHPSVSAVADALCGAAISTV